MLRLAHISVRNFAKVAKTSASAPSMQSQRIKHEVETDPVKLATYCCGANIKQTGEEVKLGADEDYPDWLWKMHLGPPLEPHQLSPDTEEYWERVHQLALYKHNRIAQAETRPEIRMNNEKKKIEITESIVHRALAYKLYDPGHDLHREDKEIYRKYGPLAVKRRGRKGESI